MSASHYALPEGGPSTILGPVYWGFIVSLVLGGITIVQAYIYFPAPKDRLIVRWTAGAMIILDLASSALVAQSVYFYLIPNFGLLSPLMTVTPEISADCLLSAIITFISQMYFVYQLYAVKRLGTTAWIIITGLFAVIAFAGGVACVASMYIFHHGVLFNRHRLFVILFGLTKGSGAITDIVATTAMCIYLTSSKTGIPETTGVLNKLIRFIIHRGALVTLIQTFLLISFYAAPDRLYWMSFHVNVTKLYANTFFAMLNGRQHLRANMSNSITFASSLHSHLPSRTRDKTGFKSDDHHLEEQDHHHDDLKSYEMPTVTKTVVVTDL